MESRFRLEVRGRPTKAIRDGRGLAGRVTDAGHCPEDRDGR